MTVFQAIVLGIVQGLSEFLPISSSAHLLLSRWILGWPDPGLGFDVALHVGTLVAVLWYFRAEWARLVRAAWAIVTSRRIRTDQERRVLLLVVATIPAGLAGLFFEEHAETVFRAPIVTAVTLIVVGVLLWLVDRVAPRERTLEKLGVRDALLIGLAQALAIVPGVSRSGATMTAARGLRLDRQSAAIFSFLMSMPIIGAAAALEAPDAFRDATSLAPLVAGVLASAASGWAAIAVLLRYVSTRSFGVFAIYRVALGLFVFALLVYRG